MKAMADNNFYMTMAQMIGCLSEKVENFVGKEENAAVFCSIFYFYHSVLKSFLSLNWLALSQKSPGFYVSAVRVLKTLSVNEKMLVTSNFSFSQSVFNPFGELCTIFIKYEIVVCKFFHLRSVQNLSFGKGLKQGIMVKRTRLVA